MADWYAITDAQVDPDAPLTSELAYAWRDNPVAMAEGALGAPRISPIAMQSNLLGYLFAGASTTPTITFTDIGRVSRVWGVLSAGSGSLQVSWQLVGSSSFTTPVTVGPFGGQRFIHLDIASGVFTSIGFTSATGGSTSFTGSGGAVQGLRLGMSGGGSGNSIGAVLFHGGD